MPKCICVAILKLEAYPPMPPLDDHAVAIIRAWPDLLNNRTVLSIKPAAVFLLDFSSLEVHPVLVTTSLALTPCIDSGYLPNPQSLVIVIPRDGRIDIDVGQRSKLAGKPRTDGEPGRELAERPTAVFFVEVQQSRWCSFISFGSAGTLGLFLAGGRYGAIVACTFRHIHSRFGAAWGLVQWHDGFLQNERIQQET